jgi:hypothetical protein
MKFEKRLNLIWSRVPRNLSGWDAVAIGPWGTGRVNVKSDLSSLHLLQSSALLSGRSTMTSTCFYGRQQILNVGTSSSMEAH